MKQKLITGTVLAGAVLVTGAAFAQTGPFRDVPADHPNRWAIEYVSGDQWFNGYPDGTFRPDRIITASQIATVINRAYPDGMTRAEFAEYMRAGDTKVFGKTGTRDRPFEFGWWVQMSGWRIEPLDAQYTASGVRVLIQFSNIDGEPGSPLYDFRAKLVGQSAVETDDGLIYREGDRWMRDTLHPGGMTRGWITWDTDDNLDHADAGTWILKVDPISLPNTPAYFLLPHPVGTA